MIWPQPNTFSIKFVCDCCFSGKKTGRCKEVCCYFGSEKLEVFVKFEELDIFAKFMKLKILVKFGKLGFLCSL